MQVHGMAADQILALEVVMADGRFVTATPTHNSDLFWALSGGGGGTFGIVTSVIVKAHPKVKVTTSHITFGSSANVTADIFFAGVKAYWDLFVPFNDAGTYSYFWVSGFGGNFFFDLNPLYAPGYSVERFNALVKPWFDRLTELGIPFTADTQHHDSFLASYDTTFAPQNYNIGGWNVIPGVRLLPRKNWETAAKRDETFAVFRSTAENFGMIGGYHQAPKNPPRIQNAVNSHFRDMASFLIVAALAPENATAAEMGQTARTLTDDVLGPLRDVSPGGGAYANEADVSEPNWQDSFWGTNYPRLFQLKKRFDPWGLFYVHHGVGSEAWEVRDGDAGVQTQNGRLCRV
jgi:FAD/FMN-containing dehydrogenase